MAEKKGKVGQIHDILPKHLNTKNNTNWKAIVEALGEQDQNISDLISEVRKQFFVKTASRPYLDRLASNYRISRPKLVGMDDPSFRQYIPILSYQPKQVKLIIDKLLDIFFFKESTTAFITTQSFSPFNFNDGWELDILVDEQFVDRIVVKTEDFTDINAATASETVATFNRQAKYCYATTYYDSITKNNYIRVFTNTVGSKGSLRIRGGRMNTALRFNGFISSSGNGVDTQWLVTKIGEDVTFQNVGGSSPGIEFLTDGDIAVIDLPGNEGSFEILEVNLVNSSIKFKNLFATAGGYTQINSDQVKFIRPDKYVAYTNPRRAMTWETSASEVLVEMPTSPPVVKRSLQGSFHTNGVFSQMSNRNSDTSVDLVDAYLFPESGSVIMEEVNEIPTRILTSTENNIVSKKTNSRLQYSYSKYEYSSRVALTTTGDTVEGVAQITNLASVVGIAIGQQVSMSGIASYARVTSISGSTVNLSVPAAVTASSVSVKFLGNTLTGISPNLPKASSLNEFTLSSISRTSNVVTVTTPSAHGYSIGEPVIISGCSGITTAGTTGDVTSSSNIITNVLSMSGIAPGIIVSGPGIPSGATITSVGVNSFVMDVFATSTNVGSSLSFSENLNDVYSISTATGNIFTFTKLGSDGVAGTAGTSRIERSGLANSGSKIILSNSLEDDDSRITGSYVWDQAAPFVLSSYTAETLDQIQAGRIVRLLNTTASDISPDGGYIIFDYGKENQEGPVRYLYKPTPNTIAIDPSYTFKYNHSISSSIVAINRKGPHQMSGKGKEYPPYITDPSEARFILQDLIRSVKSAGIFVNFLVRYPEQLYGVLDVYNQQGLGPGEPFES
jgi:hypothetical protein